MATISLLAPLALRDSLFSFNHLVFSFNLLDQKSGTQWIPLCIKYSFSFMPQFYLLLQQRPQQVRQLFSCLLRGVFF